MYKNAPSMTRTWRLSKSLTVFSFVGLLTLESHAGSRLQCFNVFHPQSLILIGMEPKYRGEDHGLYFDPSTQRHPLVKYFTPHEIREFELSIQEGRFVHSDGKKANSEYDPEDVSYEKSIFVINKEFKMYAHPEPELGRIHHSSLGQGDDVFFAGEISFDNGVVKYISHSSGHYRPKAAQALKALRWLDAQGVKLDQARLSADLAEALGWSPQASIKKQLDENQ